MLVDGKWQGRWHPIQGKDEAGRFIRQQSGFRSWVVADGQRAPAGEVAFPAEPERYRLYVARICPWASRVLMVRAMKRLQTVIPVTVVEPELGDEGWRFATQPDPELGASFIHELYSAADPSYTGRATVPVLWDRKERTIVNNESADLIQILDTAFDDFTPVRLNLRPQDLVGPMDMLNADMYRRLNNGVYRAGFASTQFAYDEAVADVFALLDELEHRLSDGGPWLFGERFTESDVRLFVTLVRFDPAYVGAFKVNRRRIADYPHLSNYLRRVLAVDGVAETVDIEHIKRGYYSIRAINPSGIVPVGPEAPFGARIGTSPRLF